MCVFFFSIVITSILPDDIVRVLYKMHVFLRWQLMLGCFEKTLTVIEEKKFEKYLKNALSDVNDADTASEMYNTYINEYHFSI